MSRPVEEDVTENPDANTLIEVYWCYAGGERKTGHWYARVCRDGQKTVGRKVKSRDHGLAWARGITRAAA